MQNDTKQDYRETDSEDTDTIVYSSLVDVTIYCLFKTVL